MDRRFVVALGLGLVIAVAGGLAYTLSSGGESEADVVIEGVQMDELAQSGFILNPAPANTAPAMTREEAIAAATAAGGVEILDTVLITFRTTDGIFADERLAWAISLDPSTAQGPPVSGPAPVFGGRHQDPGDLTRSHVLKYSVDFYDAMTGEFLVAATKSGVAE